MAAGRGVVARRGAATPGHFDQDHWCLYELHTDRNQMHELAKEQPDILAELKALWDEQAERYNGYPLDDRNAVES